jgi:hypothetical protein
VDAFGVTARWRARSAFHRDHIAYFHGEHVCRIGMSVAWAAVGARISPRMDQR